MNIYTNTINYYSNVSLKLNVRINILDDYNMLSGFAELLLGFAGWPVWIMGRDLIPICSPNVRAVTQSTPSEHNFDSRFPTSQF